MSFSTHFHRTEVPVKLRSTHRFAISLAAVALTAAACKTAGSGKVATLASDDSTTASDPDDHSSGTYRSESSPEVRAAMGAAAPASAANAIELMSYNVENLYDTKHDDGTNDWEFTPKGIPGKAEGCEQSSPSYRQACLDSDWTDPRLEVKLGQITYVMTNGRPLPDVMGLTEIENEAVLKLLGEPLGYTKILATNGKDKRGIDVGLIVRESDKLKYVSHLTHDAAQLADAPPAGISADELKIFKRFPTRDVLEVELLAFGTERLIVFVNHWPNQEVPESNRVAIARLIRALIDQRLAAAATATPPQPVPHVLVLGDFNEVPTEDGEANAFDDVLQERTYCKRRAEDTTGQPPGSLGCAANPLIDVDVCYRGDLSWYPPCRSTRVPFELKAKMPLGSYFLPSTLSWSKIDRFFVTQNLFDTRGLDLDLQSYAVHATPDMTSEIDVAKLAASGVKWASLTPHAGSVMKGVPWHYDHKADTAAAAGFSDHFPLVMRLTKLP
jgi:endonuclease/exonuclease/phosphatase family metal-dependent hydrolase